MIFGLSSEHITTYDDLKSLLLGGAHVTFLGLSELCEGNPLPETSKAQGGGYHLQFYVETSQLMNFETLFGAGKWENFLQGETYA